MYRYFDYKINPPVEMKLKTVIFSSFQTFIIRIFRTYLSNHFDAKT